jgi:hypothetical protein
VTSFNGNARGGWPGDRLRRANCDAGVDFADALHHASYKACASVATFDDRKFARRAKRLGLAPAVTVMA